jgi:hypothetical protein
MNMKNNISVLWTLLVRDALILKNQIATQMINVTIWGATIISVSHWIMPHLGVAPGYGAFMFVGNIAIWGLFEMLSDTALILTDITGEQNISYFLTLPVPHYLIFIRIGLSNAYKSFITPLPIFIIGKIILGDMLPLASISFGKFILFYTLFNLFYGFFGLFLASITESIHSITTIRTRYLFPLWFLAGYQFSWATSLHAVPFLAYVNLLNPLLYILEGLRSTILNPDDFIAFWYCFAVVAFSTLFFGYFAVKNLERRLDCIS